MGDRVGDQRVADHADAVGVGDRDRPAEQARLADPLEPGELAVAVEPVAAGEHRLGPDVALVGQDHGDAGAHRSLADDERAVALDQRRVPDAHAGDVGDGVVRPGLEAADTNAERSSGHAASTHGPWPPPQTAPISSPRAQLAGDPFHTPRRATRIWWCSASRSWTASRRWTPPRRSGTCPGSRCSRAHDPGRTGRWSYLTADPVAVVDAPSDGAGPVRRGEVDAGAAGRRRRIGRCRRPAPAPPAVRGRPRGVPRLRPRATIRAAAARSPGSTSTCPRSGSRSTTGRWPGTVGPARPGWRRGRSTAMQRGSAAECRGGPRAPRCRWLAARSRRTPPPAAPTSFASLTSHDDWIRDVEAVRDGDRAAATSTRRT